MQCSRGGLDCWFANHGADAVTPKPAESIADAHVRHEVCCWRHRWATNEKRRRRSRCGCGVHRGDRDTALNCELWINGCGVGFIWRSIIHSYRRFRARSSYAASIICGQDRRSTFRRAGDAYLRIAEKTSIKLHAGDDFSRFVAVRMQTRRAYRPSLEVRTRPGFLLPAALSVGEAHSP
jgi:hypothetical protein